MARLSQQTIEQIAAANDVVDVIGSYFPLKRAGGMFKALCPFHQEKTPSFSVNPQRQIFKCFGCGAGGSVFKFVEMYEHLSFPDAARKLAERGGVQIIEEEFTAEEDQQFLMRKRLLALHAQAAEWFHRNLMRTEAGAPAREYLKRRGITGEVAKAWQIGYAPDEWQALSDWAKREGFTVHELIESGLAKTKESDDSAPSSPQSAIRNPQSYDRFRGRVMFPICNDYGEVVAFSGRVLQSDAQAAKYINSPETILFTKGNILFGLHKSKRALIDKSSAIVCEGQLDLITAFEAGVQNVIAPQGTAFTEKQARILKRFVEEVVLCFDSDAAGQKAAERSLTALLEADLLVRVAELPAGQDPDSLIRGKGAEAFRAMISSAPDFFDYQITRQSGMAAFSTPRGKAEFAKKMGEWVSLLGNDVMRDAVVNKIAARLAMPAEDFRKTIRAQRKTRPSASSETTKLAAPPLSERVAVLCQLTLSSPAVRAWVREQPWQAVLDEHPGGALLSRIIEAHISAGDPGSIAAFMTTLAPDEQSQLAGVLDRKPAESPEQVACFCWAGIQRDVLLRRKDAIGAQLRESNLAPDRLAELQKEFMEINKRVLDLQKAFTHIARPFSLEP